MAATATWKAYQDASDPHLRDLLIKENLGLVYRCASQLKPNLSQDLEFDELVGAGVIGLVNAIDGFDPSRGHAFSTFAVPRIRGAILDELRRMDPTPRSVRKKDRQIREAEESLRTQLDRGPRQSETAAALGIDDRTLSSWKNDVQRATLVSLDEPVSVHGESPRARAETVVGVGGDALDERLTKREELDLLREEIPKLKEAHRTVLALYYFEGLKHREIAQVLDVTESRISQIRSAALRELRHNMAWMKEG